MRNLILRDGKRRPWVAERTDTEREGAPVSPAFSSWAFFAMGEVRLCLRLAVAMTVARWRWRAHGAAAPGPFCAAWRSSGRAGAGCDRTEAQRRAAAEPATT